MDRMSSVGEVQKKLDEFDIKIADAEKEHGDIEIRDAILEKAAFLKNDVKNFDKAEEVFRLGLEKTGNASKKMEILFEIMQMTYTVPNIESIKKDVEECKKCLEDGGDWEKKNKLKVYEGLYLMITREWKKASELFLDSIATFTCTELFSYEQFVFYAIILSMVS
jgi:26S proteasome regulatory subunit N7